MNRKPSIGSFVSTILQELKLPRTLKNQLFHHPVWSRWKDIVGEDLSRVTHPFTIKNQSLYVNVQHQAWAQQLYFLTHSLLEKIQLFCPRSNIKEIKFKVGKIPEPTSPEEPRFDLNLEAPVKLSEKMEMTLRTIQDPELKENVQKAMEASLRFKATHN